MAKRLIFVAGTPSGGTSCVAGVLHHLGVDMGHFMDRPGIRGYTTYEDTWAGDYKQPDGQLCVEPYIKHRLAHGSGLRGFKHTPLWLSCEADLPLRIVHVYRPLEAAILSDQRILREIAQRRGEPARTLADERDRAGVIARAWEAARQIARTYPLAHRLGFDELRRERRLHVTALASALGLPAEGARFNAAVASVRQ